MELLLLCYCRDTIPLRLQLLRTRWLWAAAAVVASVTAVTDHDAMQDTKEMKDSVGDVADARLRVALFHFGSHQPSADYLCTPSYSA